MPKIHFPIVDGTKLDDPSGLELKNKERATRQAEAIARQLALVQESKDARNVVVVDDDGAEFYKAPVRKRD